MIVDDLHDATSETRGQTRSSLAEKLLRPLNPAKATAADDVRWAELNAQAMHQQGMGGDDDPNMAKPVVR